VEEAEKAKEKERRQRVRDAKIEEEKRLQNERIERSVERAQASITKKIGKPVMFRCGGGMGGGRLWLMRRV
jgi:hypothetical protein